MALSGDAGAIIANAVKLAPAVALRRSHAAFAAAAIRRVAAPAGGRGSDEATLAKWFRSPDAVMVGRCALKAQVGTVSWMQLTTRAAPPLQKNRLWTLAKDEAVL